MSVPTIAAVTPSRGHTGGHAVVEITGTNFRLPDAPPATGPVASIPPSVRVFFGTSEARRVGVISATRLYAVTGPHDLPKGSDELLVDVEVRNVGPFGETIGSEVAVAVDAFTYARPMLDASNESNLARMTRTLIRALKREVLEEVVLTQNTDWDDDPAETLRKMAIAKLPAVYLVGPTMRASVGPHAEQRNARELVQETEAQVLEHRAPYMVDLAFTLGALSDNYMQLLGLMEGLTNFLLRNPYLLLERSPGSSERLEYEVRFDTGGELQVDLAPDSSNVHSASGNIVILGFPVLASPGFTRDMASALHPSFPEGGPEIDLQITTGLQEE